MEFVVDQVDVDLAGVAGLGARSRDAVACQRVDQAGFADVGAADEGDLGQWVEQNLILANQALEEFRGFNSHAVNASR